MSRCCCNPVCTCACRRSVNINQNSFGTPILTPFYSGCPTNECRTGYYNIEETGYTRQYLNNLGNSRFKSCLPNNWQASCNPLPQQIVDGYWNHHPAITTYTNVIGGGWGNPNPVGGFSLGGCFTGRITMPWGVVYGTTFLSQYTNQGVKLFLGANDYFGPLAINENILLAESSSLAGGFSSYCPDSIESINTRYTFHVSSGKGYFYKIKPYPLNPSTIPLTVISGPPNRFIPQNNPSPFVIFWPGGITGSSNLSITNQTTSGSMSVNVSLLVVANLKSLNGCPASTIISNFKTIQTNTVVTGTDEIPLPFPINDILAIRFYPFIHYNSSIISSPLNEFTLVPTGLQVWDGVQVVDQMYFQNNVNGVRSNILVGVQGDIAFSFKSIVQVSARHNVYYNNVFNCNGSVVEEDPANTVNDYLSNETTPYLTDVDCDVLADFTSCDEFKTLDIDTTETIFSETQICLDFPILAPQTTETNNRTLIWRNAACDYYIETDCGFIDKTISIGGTISADDVTLEWVSGKLWQSVGGATVEFGDIDGYNVKYTRANGDKVYGYCSSCVNPRYLILKYDIDGNIVGQVFLNNGLLA